jgi:hypothetical protein
MQAHAKTRGNVASLSEDDGLSPSTTALRRMVDDHYDQLFKPSTMVDSSYASDVPSDEMSDKATKSRDQNLNGFSKSGIPSASSIERGLTNWGSPQRSHPYARAISPDSDSDELGDDSHNFSDEAQMAGDDSEAIMKERRRIKHVSRKNRAERKQPPVTMEV